MTKIYRVLSLDGGGMKGLFSAYFMKRFCQDAGIPGNEIYKHFDIIAGSSIGGIAALGYAFGLSPDDLINFFRTKGSTIFPGGLLGSLKQLYNFIIYGYIYNNGPLKTELNTIFQEAKMFQLKTNVLITSVETRTIHSTTVGDESLVTSLYYRPVIFSNMKQPDLEGQNYLIKDVALATSAAPIYFPEATISEVTDSNLAFMDGGIYQNNPSALEWAMANSIAPSVNRICVLSVGCGLGTVGFFNPIDIPDTQPTSSSKYIGGSHRRKAYTQEEILAARSILIKGGWPEDKINALETLVGWSIPGISSVIDAFYLLIDVVDIATTGPQEATNKQLEWLSLHGVKINNKDLFYFRFQTIFDPTKDTELDSTSQDFMDYMKKAAEEQYAIDQLKISAFIENLNFGN